MRKLKNKVKNLWLLSATLIAIYGIAILDIPNVQADADACSSCDTPACRENPSFDCCPSPCAQWADPNWPQPWRISRLAILCWMFGCPVSPYTQRPATPPTPLPGDMGPPEPKP